MKPLFFLSALLFIFSLPACNKDDNNNPNGIKLLDYYTEELYPNTTSFTYNSDNQIIKTEDNEETNTLVINGNQLHYTEYRKSESRTTADATFTLNAAGNIASGHGNFEYALGSPFSADFTFTYDNAGNLTKRTDVRSDGMTNSYELGWTNGDNTSVRWIYHDSLYLTITTSYDLSKPDKLKIGSNYFLMQMNSFVGNHNQHLPNHSFTVFAPGTTKVQQYDFSFSLDGDGYPVTQNINNLDGIYSDVYHYHYK